MNTLKTDIFCKDKLCPICGSQMNTTTEPPIRDNKGRILRIMQMIACKNNCFAYERNIVQNGANVESFFIFHEQTAIPMSTLKWEREPYYAKVRRQVKYWKEKERYLLQILTN